MLKEVVDLDPDNWSARCRLGEQYARQENLVEAVSEFRRAAAYLQKNARHDDYLRVAERISHFDQGDATLARELAEIYLGRGDAKRALAKLQICFKANPRDLQTLQMLARAFQSRGRRARRSRCSRNWAASTSTAGVPRRRATPTSRRRSWRPRTRTSRARSSSCRPSPRLGVAARPGRGLLLRRGSSARRRAVRCRARRRGSRFRRRPRPGRPPRPSPRRPAPSRAPAFRWRRRARCPRRRRRCRRRSLSAAPPPPPPAPQATMSSIPKLLKETEVYVKYGLHEKACSITLGRVLLRSSRTTPRRWRSRRRWRWR